MKLNRLFSLILLISITFVSYSCNDSQSGQNEAYKAVTETSADGKYTYKTVKGDPLKTRIYTLENGLQVYMTVNKAEPRIQTAIAIKAGSKSDPADATGLAHYLEHLLFKGTDKYGSLDYEKERPLLAEIDNLYEEYRSTTDPEARKAIYKKIDDVSGEAAKFAIANEYDKMLSSIGAKGTNAFTSFEQTVYINDIPSNQLEKWLSIEAERFRKPVFRLFHTELEAVYEEKNISLDSDRRKAFEKLFSGLYKNHNYGLQTTIGTVDHLKNPSIKKIRDYFNQFYVPNNMAILLSGDLDPDKTIDAISQKFSYMEKKDVPELAFTAEEPITSPEEISFNGPEEEFLYLAFRFGGNKSEDVIMIKMIDMILANSTAGLIDLNLNQQQKVLEASSFVYELNDYSSHILSGQPRQGQSLEEVRDLLLEQIELIKKGEFDENLLSAIVNDMEKSRMQEYERNSSRMFAMLGTFTSNQEWIQYVQEMDELRMISKQQIMDFANANYSNNYVSVFKGTGEKEDVAKVEKPKITPVEVNRESESPFLTALIATEAPDIQPRFLDFDKDLQFLDANNGVKIHYVRNEENKLFTMYYLFDFGRMHDKQMDFAIQYLPFLGTETMTPEEVKKNFYELGCDFDVFTSHNRIYVYLNGLDQNYEEGVKLFEDLLANAKPNQEALDKLIEGELKSREDAKLNKRAIKYAMRQYGIYGARNKYNDILSNEELKTLTPENLTDKIHSLTSFQHRIFYYGPDNEKRVVEVLNNSHNTPAEMMALPVTEPYTKLKAESDRVYFVNHEGMVQADIYWGTAGNDFDPAMSPMVALYNEYYGGNMSSIIFQTIRESKALAYSTFSSYSSGWDASTPYFLTAYVGTQSDKIHDAIAGMNELLTEMPKSEILLQSSKDAILNRIRTERTIRTNILFAHDKAMRFGYTEDFRKLNYEKIADISFEDLEKFHGEAISGNNFNMMILGDQNNINLEELDQYGEVSELNLKDVFGY